MKLRALLLTLVIAWGGASPLTAKSKYKAPKSHSQSTSRPKVKRKPVKVKPMKVKKAKRSSRRQRTKPPAVRTVNTPKPEAGGRR